jgi:hypothetical protein
MRPRTLALALLAAAALPAVPAGATPADVPLVRMRDGHGSDLLFRLNERTLQQVGRPVRTYRNGLGLGFSPDGTRIAYSGGGPRFSGIQFVDLAGWRALGKMRVGKRRQGQLDVGWVSDDRIVAFAGDWSGTRRALWIDVRTRRVLARRSVTGYTIGSFTVPGGLVLALSPDEGLAPLRIVILNATGGMRTIKLDGMEAGADHESWRGEALTPAVTVDPESGRLYAIAARGHLAAEVDLVTGAVAYHSLGAGASKGNIAVWWRQAAWAGDGKVAVTGQHWPRQSGRRLTDGPVPLGVRIVETADWSIRTLDSRTDTMDVAGDTILAAGTRFFDAGQRKESTGLLAFDEAGRRAFTRFSGIPVVLLGSRGPLAYVWIRRDLIAHVIDLDSGRTINRIRTGNRVPSLLSPP